VRARLPLYAMTTTERAKHAAVAELFGLHAGIHDCGLAARR